MSHVASGDFTSFVSSPTNPISLPKLTAGLNGGSLKAGHKYLLAHTQFLIYLVILIVRCLSFSNNVAPVVNC